MTANDYGLPSPPEISEEQIKKCHASGDYCPIMYEYYKFTGLLSNFFARIRLDSPDVKSINRLHHAVLIGLLNRCSRLMLSNLALSQNGLFGETTSIIDRCIFESSIKIIWLCDEPLDGKFEQFIADGLKTEIRLKDHINANDNRPVRIKAKMLESIERYIRSSGLTEDQIALSNSIPNMYDMLKGHGDELLYIIAQKVGSHHVHGTWPSLILHYLNLDEDGYYSPRGHDCHTHVNQYAITILFVLRAIKHYVKYIITNTQNLNYLILLVDAAINVVMKFYTEAIRGDFDVEG